MQPFALPLVVSIQDGLLFVKLILHKDVFYYRIYAKEGIYEGMGGVETTSGGSASDTFPLYVVVSVVLRHKKAPSR